MRFAFGTAAAGLLLPALARRAAAQAPPLVADELRDGLLQITSGGGNALALRAADGLALVDSGSAEAVTALRALLEERFGAALPDVLLNTHWHLPHTGGNDAFGAAGTTIVAHENTRLWMGIDVYVDWEDETYPARAPAALPTKTFYTSDPQPIVVTLGDEEIEYGHLPGAHTDGDIYVRFIRRNVIAAGGAVSVGRYPVPDTATGGWIGGIASATARLLEMADADTLIVPAEGPAQSRDHLEAQLEMLTTIRGRMEEQMRIGKSAADMLDAGLTAEFDPLWGNNARRFVSNVYEGLWWGGRLGGAI